MGTGCEGFVDGLTTPTTSGAVLRLGYRRAQHGAPFLDELDFLDLLDPLDLGAQGTGTKRSAQGGPGALAGVPQGATP